MMAMRTSSPLALAAARLATVEQGSNQHQRTNGAKREQFSKENSTGLTLIDAARACGVSRAAVRRGREVLADGVDELIAYVEQGLLALSAAWWAEEAA